MQPQTVTCQRCGTRFERTSRRPPKYCPDCRPIVKRLADRERDRAKTADLADKRATLRSILEPMRDYLTDDMIVTAERYIDSLEPDSVIALVNDQQPTGTMSPGGSDDGHTTEFDDLAAELDERRVAAIMHEWHADNPGWWNT